MRLTSLHGSLHGIIIDLDNIAPLTVWSGPNASGKTTHLHAIEYLTRPPSRGLPNMDLTGDFFGPDSAMPLRIHRSNPTHQLLVNDMNRGGRWEGVKKAQPHVERILGTASAWNAGAFLAASGRARGEQLATLVDYQWSREQLGAALAEAGVPLGTVELNAPDTSSALLDRAVKEAGEAWRSHNRIVTNLRGAKRAGQAAIPADLPAGSVASWRAEAARIDAELADLRRLAGTVEGIATQREQLTQRLAFERQEETRAQRAHTVARTAASRTFDSRGLTEEKLTADKAAAESLRERAESLRRQRDELTREAEAATRAASDAERLCFLGLGPEVVANMAAEVSRAAHDADVSLGLTSATLARLSNMHDRADEASTQVADLEAEARAAGAQYEAAHRASKAKADRWRADSELRSSLLHSHESSTVLNTERADAALDKAAQHSAAAAELEAQIASLPETDAALPKRIEGLERQRAAALKNADRLTDAAALTAASAARTADAKAAELARSNATATGNALRAAQADLMRQSLSVLTDPASRITERVFSARLTFGIDKGALALKLGSRPLEHCSESETTVALCALQIAVMTRLPGWRVVILDGLEHIDTRNRAGFLDAVTEMVDHGDLHQFFGAIVHLHGSGVPERPGLDVRPLVLENP